MGSAVIVAAVRTPIGKRGGVLAGLHAAQILGTAQATLLDRAGLDPAAVEQVAGGCVTQAGEQSGNVTRTAWLHRGLPYRTGWLAAVPSGTRLMASTPQPRMRAIPARPAGPSTCPTSTWPPSASPGGAG